VNVLIAYFIYCVINRYWTDEPYNENYFQQLLIQMESCRNFEELIALCDIIRETIYPLSVSNFCNVRLEKDNLDINASALYPADSIIRNEYPIKTGEIQMRKNVGVFS
jgi:hypothetical protein